MSDSLNAHRQNSSAPVWHAEFLRMLPKIEKAASFFFRDLLPEARQEAVQDVVVGAVIAYVRLFETGRADLAYPTILARYGAAQYRSGRRNGTPLNCRDVLSPYAQQKKKFGVLHLHRYNRRRFEWREILVEDKRATPADVAAMRIDFADWMKSLTSRQRRIASLLASGETTSGAARKLQVSPGRISQFRRELKESWDEFQGEAVSPVKAAAGRN